MGDLVTITSGPLTAAINPFGAELTSLRDAAGRELMTDADPAFWGGHAPILFPIVGRLSGDVLRVDGREYPMKQHGFARRSMFAVIEAGESRAVFRLTETEETRRTYPFAFRLDLAFALADATLSIEATIANPGDAPLPASFGFHPAFAWPLPYGAPRESHSIIFSEEGREPIKRLETGLIAGDRPTPLEGYVLNLADEMFLNDALIWFHPKSSTVIYGGEDEAQLHIDYPQLHIHFPDTPYLGIWSQPGAHFVCVEPWHGHADPAGYTGEFRHKPGVFEVASGGSKRIAMSVSLLA